MSFSAIGTSRRVLFPLLLAFVGMTHATTFTVNTPGAASADSAAITGHYCDINPTPGNQDQCTLEAAIQVSNQTPGFNVIKFSGSISKVLLDASLSTITVPVSIDGSSGGNGRVELDGAAGAYSCFDLDSVGAAGGPSNTFSSLANNTQILNMDIHDCQGDGIAINGHGYVIQDNFVGVLMDGQTAAPNTGNGISIGADVVNNPIPDMSGFSTQPGVLSDVSSILAYYATTPMHIYAPSGIIHNTTSGNQHDGIYIFSDYETGVVVADNFVGTDALGSIAVPNGTGGGSDVHGIAFIAAAYGNFIGPNNVVAGNNSDPNSDGINVGGGSVPFPNFILGNYIGTSAAAGSPDLGNSLSGIKVESAQITIADPNPTPPVQGNPLNQSLVIGPGNIVGYNKGASSQATPLTDNNEQDAGIALNGNNDNHVRVFGNFVGVTATGASIPNAGDGINVAGTLHEIGGATLALGNVIGKNGRHGVVIRGLTMTSGVVVHGNSIGVLPADDTTDIGNVGQGIWLLAGGNQIGADASDPTQLQANRIAFNHEHGIQLTGSAAWSNLIRHNSIFQVPANKLGIDLDQTVDGPDATDNSSVMDRTTSAQNYSNWQQNTVVLNSAAYDASSGNTAVNWTLASGASGSYRVEFYVNDTNAIEGKTLLSEQTVVTDPSGAASGNTPLVPVSPQNTETKFITATVTDILPTTPSEPMPPGATSSGPANNTSEFSNAVRVPQPGQLSFEAGSVSMTVNEGAGTATLKVQRVNGSDNAVSVDYAITDGTATSGLDYTASNGTLHWNDGDATSQPITINIIDDNIHESDETVNLQLSNPVGGASLGAATAATLTIQDNDPQPQVSITSVAQAEGNAGTSPFVFVVSLSNPSSQTVSVTASTSDGTATVADSDYVANSALLTFAPGVTTQNFNVLVNGDTKVEPDETFAVTLSSPSNASLGISVGTGTILNDDAAGKSFSIDDVSHNEGNAGTTAFTFTVTRTDTTTAAAVNVVTADVTATAGSDYTALASTAINFAVGVGSMPVTVQVNGDTTFEPDETFQVNLSNPTGGFVIAKGQGIGTILNDDTQPTISIGDVSHLEGNSGTTPFVFPVTLSSASSQTVTVNAQSADGTANAGSDYIALSPTVITFAPGEVSKTATVMVNGDTTVEPDETFVVNLTAPTNATLLKAQGTGTIQNDDAAGKSFSISDVSLPEGNAGTTAFTFTVTRTDTTTAATVNVATADVTATAGSDYTAVASTAINFAVGVGSMPVTVQVNGDTTFEPDETFQVNLSNPTGGFVLAKGQGIGTIVNDDTQPTISIADVSHLEGNSGTTPFVFAITLSNASSQTVSVSAQSADGTAAAGSDYVALPATVVSFAPGEVSKTATVLVNGDTTVEPDETFFVNLTAPTNATLAKAQGTGTIQNDDAAGKSFSINDVSLPEGNAGTTAFTFSITRSDTTAAASVDVSTADVTATAGSDYTALPITTINFAVGVGSMPVLVQVNGDTTFEPDETFQVNLSNPTGGFVLAKGQGTGTIQNDDTQPTISISDVNQAEGNSGTTPFVFNVTLSSASSQTVSVTAQSANGTATAGSDYNAFAATVVSFAPGETSKPISVQVIGDTTVEPDETFFVNLTSPVNATLAKTQGTGTIQNDDGIVTTLGGSTATGTGPATIAISGGGASCSLTQGSFIGAPPGAGNVPPTAPPGNYTFPQGLVNMQTSGCTSAGTVQFSITYSQPLPANTVYWKYGPTSGDASQHWYQIPASISGSTITFSITDGGLGDDDLAANGSIVDPGGPAVPAATGGGTGATVPVPSLQDAGRYLLMLLLLVLGAVGVRRRAAG